MIEVTDLLEELSRESSIYLTSWLAPAATPASVYRGVLKQDDDGDWFFQTISGSGQMGLVGVELGSVDGPSKWRKGTGERTVYIAATIPVSDDGRAVVQTFAVGEEPATRIPLLR